MREGGREGGRRGEVGGLAYLKGTAATHCNKEENSNY